MKVNLAISLLLIGWIGTSLRAAAQEPADPVFAEWLDKVDPAFEGA